MSNEKIYQAPDGSLLSEHDYRHLSTGQQNQCKIFEMEKMEEIKECKCSNPEFHQMDGLFMLCLNCDGIKKQPVGGETKKI